MSAVKRRTRSCALCRKRKVKCNPDSFPCDSCQKLGAPCTGGDIDSTVRSEVPRSLFSWLQNEIDWLELTGSDLLTPSTSPQETPSHTAPGITHISEAVSRDIKFPWIGFEAENPLPGFIFHTEARLPSLERTSWAHSSMPPLSQPKLDSSKPNVPDPLQALPVNVADFLLEAYIARAMSSYPIFYETSLRAYHNSIFHNTTGQQPTVYELFTINLVMAVSLSTAARTKQKQANDMSLRLFQQAMTYISKVLLNDIEGIQAILILAVFAVMNPATANAYFLCGYAMQACIDLGLHREDLMPPETDLRLQDLKRRVFWTAWELDTSCNTGFTRPIALSPKCITTGFPCELEDSAIEPGHINPRGRKSKFMCGRVRSFRAIEVEVVSTLVHGENHNLPSGQFQGWAAGIEQRIHCWRDEIHFEASVNVDLALGALWDEMVVYSDIADPLVIFTLFRPCTKIPTPTTENLLKAFDSALKLTKGYQKQANMSFGSPKYTFQPCHHVFSAGTVVLHTLRTNAPDLAAIYSLEQIEENISLFYNFFTQTSERWPAAIRCFDEFKRLAEPVWQAYSQYVLASGLEFCLQQNEGPDHDIMESMYEPFDFPNQFMYSTGAILTEGDILPEMDLQRSNLDSYLDTYDPSVYW